MIPIVISTPFQPDSYERILATCGGSPVKVFTLLGLENCKRFFSQQSVAPPSDAYLESFFESIWALVHAEGLPRPLPANELGAAITFEDSYLFNLIDRTLLGLPHHRTDDILRILCFQVLTTLLAPEFKSCRQSYQSRDETGTCARQNLEHCEDRISGSHCEDCPFFIALSQDQHRKLLGRSFGTEHQDAFLNNRGVFLPEDFRSLRIFWYLHVRQP